MPDARNPFARRAVRFAHAVRRSARILVDPGELICPITTEVPENPCYIDSVYSGRVFEREMIQEWIAKTGTHPLTRAPVTAECISHVQDRDLVRHYMTQVQPNIFEKPVQVLIAPGRVAVTERLRKLWDSDTTVLRAAVAQQAGVSEHQVFLWAVPGGLDRVTSLLETYVASNDQDFQPQAVIQGAVMVLPGETLLGDVVTKHMHVVGWTFDTSVVLVAQVARQYLEPVFFEPMLTNPVQQKTHVPVLWAKNVAGCVYTSFS